MLIGFLTELWTLLTSCLTCWFFVSFEMGLQFCGAQNGVKMGVLNAPRRAIWICSVVSLTAFLIFFCFPVSSFYPL
ncbi:Chanoclavine-I aldehyde reductase fgaOx3 [Fusarium oxysporum f. sp. albedinis]|nr:Chanoclavine-I aldehyde reductase fgaOx3 [Fusarium oxysporum f. sp. albedinis]